MPQKTALSVIGTPGGIHSFSSKEPAAGGKGIGPFTELNIFGVPGPQHSFAAKAPAAGEKGTGRFTALSNTALPGQIHAFIAKEPAEIPVALPRFGRFKPLPVPQEFRHEGEVWTLVEAGAGVNFTPARGSFSFRSRVSMRAGAHGQHRFSESEDRKRILRDDEDLLLLESF